MDNNIWLILLLVILVVFGGWWLIRFFNKNKSQDINLRFCPKCGSQNISVFKEGPASGLYGGVMERQYKCDTCNFRAALFPVADDEEELKKIQKKLGKKK